MNVSGPEELVNGTWSQFVAPLFLLGTGVGPGCGGGRMTAVAQRPCGEQRLE
jgi:hypothetical protein